MTAVVRVPAQYQGDVLGAAKAYGIAPNDLGALLFHESSFDPRARSSAGALGIAQLMPATANSLGVNPWNPRAAIFGSAKYLHQLDYSKDRKLAFAKYNAGPNNPAAGAGYADTVDALSRNVLFGTHRATPSSSPAPSSPAPASSSGGSWQDWVKRTALTLTLAGTGLALSGVAIRNLMNTRKVPA
jgi:membrane-bound lytic murein transglycosylase B